MRFNKSGSYVMKPLKTLLLSIFCLIALHSQSQVYIQFIENLNQWHNNVVYKADIPSGSIFLEKNCFTYCFYDYLDVHHCHHPADFEGGGHDDIRTVDFHAFRVKFLNSQTPQLNGDEPFKHYYNFFMGKDPAKWASHVNCYHAVEYSNIYNGIDIRVYQDSFSLKYDFIIGQGGKPGDIKMLYDGVNRIFIDDGNLVVRTSVNELVEKQPYAYQLIDGVETKVNCEFVLKNNIVSFKTGNYRKDLPLIIDPVLIFSSYSGSYSNNFGYTASYDAEGHLYSGSTAFGPDYPLTNGAFQTSYAGDTDPSNINHGTDVAITKWEIDGTDLIYSTLLGGDKDELPHSIYLDSEGSLYVYGTTGSANFPVSADGYDQSYNGGTAFNPVGLGVGFPTGSDIFVSKLSPDGSALLGSTYLGGSLNDGLNIGTLKYNYADEVRGEVLLDYKGNVYIVSSTLSSNFPIVGGFQPNSAGGLEGCVVKLKNDLSSILWSSYVGGTGTDAAYSIVLDSDNNIYISGGTNSNNFPTTSGTLYPNYIGGLSDAFVTKISEDGSGILVSSYYGSVAYDQAYFVELNSNDEVYLFGQTTASGSTLIQNAVYGTPGSGQFISVLSSDLDQVIRSTVFGTGNGVNISPTAFLVDVCNKIYICGWGGGTNQPGLGNGGWTYGMEVTGPPNQAYQSTTDGSDFYLAVFEDDLSAIHYGTFMGGNMSHEHVDGGTSRFSKTGKIYEAVCAGCNYSAGVPPGNSDFPTYPNPGAWSNTNNHYCNLAVFKFDFLLPLTIADFSLPLHVCAPYQHYFNNLSYNATDYYWDFGDGTYSTDSIPVHMFDSVGSYTVMLIASNTNSCNFTDTAYHYIHVHDISINVPGDTSICQGQNVIFNVQSSEPNAEYVFSTHINFSDTINSNTSSGYLAVQPSVTTTYYISVSGTYCDKQDSVTVWVRNANIYAGADTAICYGDTIALFANNLVPGDILDYQWNNIPTIISGDTTGNPLVYPLAGTMYSVTVINQYGCQDIDSVFVQVNNVNLVNDNHQDVICFGDCDGMAGVTASGSSSFTYQWDNNMTGAIIQDLCPGTYTVVATDNIGCTATISVTITEPPLLEAAITEIVNTVCDSVNGNIGTATVTPWGGSPGYTYLWSDNQDDSTAIALYAGNYQVVVTDSHGCDTTLTVQIDDGSNLEINTNSYDAYCYGVCDGGASVTVTQAGTPPYTYGWDNGQSMSTADSLCAGMHYVTVVDADYCFRVDYFVIQQPGPLLPVITALPIACNGDSTDLHASVSGGGTPPYTYEWNTGFTGQDLLDVYAGTYWVVATDDHDCKDTAWITLTNPPVLAMDTITHALACAQACNGSISVTMTGGVSPYYYNWSNGGFMPGIHDLCSGYYTVTLSDALGCSFTVDFFIGISDYVPPLDATADDYYIYVGQGTQLHATDTDAYYYIWKPPGLLNSSNIANPYATPEQTTSFEVMVIDNFGCTNIDTVTIFVSEVICDEPFIYVPNAFTPNGDGQNDILYVESNVVDELYFAVYDRWGEIMFETTDISKGWDGKYHGELVDPAVFVYYMKAVCLDKMTFIKKGNITVIR